MAVKGGKKSPKSEWEKLREDISADMTRTVDVIAEDFDRKLDLVIEGQVVLAKRVESHHKEFSEFRSEVDYKFERVFEELHLIRSELKEKVSREEFIVLEKRVMALEKRAQVKK